MTPNELAKRISQLADAESIHERAETLVFHACLDEREERSRWATLSTSPPSYLRSVRIYYAGTDGEVQQGDRPPAGQRFRISVHKALENEVLRLFFSASLPSVSSELERAHSVELADITGGEVFETHFARYQPWDNGAVPLGQSSALPDPRKFVRDLTGSAVVPADPRPWLVQRRPQSAGNSYIAWQRLATPRLLASLANEVTSQNGSVVYRLTGPPSRTLALGNEPASPLIAAIQEVAEWVYAEARDTETRHLLFAAELARSYNPRINEPLEETFRRSLESAHAAYRAYVKAESRETLKALAELRKAVLDETQKTSQRAHDLASALWKDIAVAASPFVLKILADAAKVESSHIAAGLAFGAAIFLAFSFAMPVYINSRFFKHQGESRTSWLLALSTMLPSEEIKAIGEQPVNESLRTYRRVRWAIGIFYVGMITILLYFGWLNLDQRSTSVDASGSGNIHGILSLPVKPTNGQTSDTVREKQ